MALDGAFLSNVKRELGVLIGGRVDKISQPSREEIVIAFRTRGGNEKLLFSAAAGSARVNITKAAIENPKVPPMFCMLMRKHLGGGRLLDIRQDGLERILYFDFEAMNELGDMVKITLAAEIMGRCSNLVIINADGKIIDSIKRVDAEMSRERMVLPGMTYTCPPRDERLDFRSCTAEDIASAAEPFPEADLAKTLIKIFEGLSPIVAREWVYYAAQGGEAVKSDLRGELLERLAFAVQQTARECAEGKCAYTAVKDGDGLLKDFSFIPIYQYGGLMTTKEFDTACELLDYFYTERDSVSRMKQRSRDMYGLLQSTSERIARRLANQREELKISAERDKLKLYGDLISANLYRVEKGMGSVTVENFYDENCPQIEIKLDKRLTPSQNMQRYYGEYRKADTAEKILTQQIAKGEEELAYIDSVFDALTRAKGEDEVNELRLELAEQGYIRSSKLKGKPPKAHPPLEFKSPEGFTILIGRNNKQNDMLTTKLAEKTDIWLHTKDITGSHVIIRAEGKPVPDETVLYAARLAAFHSKAKNSSQVPVDYVPVKLVKKPAGAKPGMVIFTGNRTLYVKPLNPDGEE
ncbi:MAG: NFACT family protein [Ruminococcus sp.]|nr:NFACT family protein [Ruminococcus sp.]MCM1381534.1 NFACT family protein [Muribaculaceae bacterium]MCM1479559.1 NFACT family protein [Muribaculaceae bacterium]